MQRVRPHHLSKNIVTGFVVENILFLHFGYDLITVFRKSGISVDVLLTLVGLHLF